MAVSPLPAARAPSELGLLHPLRQPELGRSSATSWCATRGAHFVDKQSGLEQAMLKVTTRNTRSGARKRHAQSQEKRIALLRCLEGVHHCCA
eukprot:CAMPEP_0113249272 /NCGR_PEP_ID=MMETSP0008_2-20120614/10966_1 /TAXON_ID=97485 /ORGANISM="Prymnesium parvum" /LENGTH=91 /DNA_ID=CAMNT_0000097185 /DNA_START=615 /DNA_END=890 /DNA_ORIENTATION=- /assembly_acc=CAM_ASM_000153